MNKSLTDRQVVDMANELARDYYKRLGYEVPFGYRFDKAIHPQEIALFDMACIAFDFCNNPADAMPIIIDSKIAAVPQLNGDLWVCSRHPFYVTTNNLYRAAMELFLLMKDAENSNGN